MIRDRREYWWTQPVGVALRGCVGPLLQRADSACLRFEDHRDGEALHDLRVALRRLRALLRAYRPHLSRLGKKLPRELGTLMRGSNSARDVEVILAWAGAQRSRLDAAETDGLEWLLQYWSRRDEHSYEELRSRVPRCWAKLRTKIQTRMEDIASVPDAKDLSYAQVTALVVGDLCDDLARRMQETVAGGDVRSAHRVRIAAKRLRYLLEPYGKDWPAAAALVSELTTLQDELGALNDSVVLIAALRQAIRDAAGEYAAARLEAALAVVTAVQMTPLPHGDPLPGFRALAGLVQQQRDELCGRIRSASWGEAGKALVARARGIATTLQTGVEKTT